MTASEQRFLGHDSEALPRKGPEGSPRPALCLVWGPFRGIPGRWPLSQDSTTLVLGNLTLGVTRSTVTALISSYSQF